MNRILSFFFLLTLFLSAQSYQQLWSEVDRLDEQNLPKSALVKVESIYKQAKKEQNDIEILHAILEKMRFKSRLVEDGDKEAILFLEDELKKGYSRVNIAVIKSILAQLYDNYKIGHRYSISDRTALLENSSTNIDSWSVDKLINRATSLYLESLDTQTMYVDTTRYKAILNDAKNVDKLEPTLYDVLAFRVLRYYEQSYIDIENSNFKITNPIVFGDIDSFVNYKFETNNTKLPNYQSLLLYQKLLRFHKQHNNSLALEHIDINRLNFAYKNFVGKNRDRYYIDALFRLKAKNKEALYYLAKYYRDKKDYKKAMEYLKEALKSSNRYIYNISKQIKNEIETQILNVQLESVNLPDDNILAMVEFRNIDKIYIKVIKSTPQILSKLNQYRDGQNRIEYINSLTPVKKFNIALPKTDDYKRHSTELSFGSYGLGEYLIVVSKDRDFLDKRAIVLKETISKIGYIYKNREFIVIDRETGEPLDGVEADFYEYKNRLKIYTTVKSNRDGLIRVPTKLKRFFVAFHKGDDRLSTQNSLFYPHIYSNNRKKATDEVMIFTDRAIYRPSQKIYFKGVAFTKYRDKRPKLLANREITISLYNRNNQKIDTKEFKSDEFGSFDGYFIAPKSGRLGYMRIKTENIFGSKSIRVEEYKRPKFEIVFNPSKKTYRVGDRVLVSGEVHSLSAYGVSGAKVKYTIQREASFPWWDWSMRATPISHSRQIASGETTTDNKGSFDISFEALANSNIDSKYRPLYRYTVSVDITDSTGETHFASKSINIGDVSIQADMLVDSRIDIDNNRGIELITTNLDGEFQPLKGRVDIEKVQPEDRVYRDRYWSSDIDKPLYSKEEFKRLFPDYRYYKSSRDIKKRLIKSISFDTKKSKTIKLENLPQGRYIFTLYITDRYGNELKKRKENIIIYKSDSKVAPITTHLWYNLDRDSYRVSQTAKLTLKSSTEHNFVFLRIQRKNQMKSKWIELNRIKERLIKISKEDRGDILYQIIMIKNSRIYSYKGVISVPWDDKLKVEFVTFRDKLKPNSKEQWRIQISGKEKEKVVAQMVATMYDASLDKFVAHNFDIPKELFPYQRYIYDEYKSRGFDTIRGYNSWFKYLDDSDYYNRVFYDIANRYIINDMGMGGDIAPAPMAETSIFLSQLATTSREIDNSYINPYSDETETISNEPIYIRKNLQETMFFKPNLKTDSDGNIIIDFKTNDALTRWRFLGFVFAKDLRNAIIKKEVVTQKELMVVTNLPRFFREGDKIKLTQKIVNLSDKNLTGECELKLTNPINGWNIYGSHKFIKPFSVAKGGFATVTFYIRVPSVDTVPLIEHTVIARTKTHTDAEQVIKPILTNREFVTESKAIWIKAKERKSFTLESLKENNSTTLKNYKLIVEFTSNPIWYALESMPYLMKYPHECNEQLFSRYFANSVAFKVLNSNPKIKKVFDSWRKNGQIKSKLSLNQELKSAMLEDTPWLLNAQSEEQQQKNMVMLFDLDKMANEQKEVLTQLLKRQNSDGGWSWFGGGKSNWYITQYILEGFAKLNHIGVSTPSKTQISKAIAFIDKEIEKEYKILQDSIEKGYRKLEDDNLNSLIIHYLYVRKLHNIPLKKSISKIYDYYLLQIVKYGLTKGLYEQALIAMTLDNSGYKKEAMSIIKSLKENAIVNKKGMYFKYPRGYYWYQMPIETQSIMIELFNRVAHDKKSVEELKVWLLQNRQTNHWATTKSTVGAIYALMLDDKWVDSDRLVDISFDTKIDYKPTIQKAKALAQKGTGYFKAIFNKFDKSMATIKVKNPTNHIAWGGVYWQYFENIDKIKSSKETPLTIDKQILKLKNTKLVPIDSLNEGDKVKVRLTIRVDRDMEFVMLKDSRASAFEPTNVLSQYKYQGGLGYYESTKDRASYFFFDYLPRGTYIFEYPLVVTHRGEFSSGIATIESMYAPEFRSHSSGGRVVVSTN